MQNKGHERGVGGLTLPGILVSLSVNHLLHSVSIQESGGVVIEGFERLAGAVGLLRRHPAVVALGVGGAARAATLFVPPALCQRAVRPALLHIHAALGAAGLTAVSTQRSPQGAPARTESSPRSRSANRHTSSSRIHKSPLRRPCKYSRRLAS